VPARQRAQWPLPRRLAEEVGDDHAQPAPARRPAQLLDGLGQVAAGAAGRAGGAGDPAQHPACVRQAAAGRDAFGVFSGGHDRADPVAAAPGQVRDRGQRRDGEIALLAGRGAEVQAG
jgi:hypothetical protein